MNRRKGIGHIFSSILFFMGSAFVFVAKNTYENDWSNKFKSDYESTIAWVTFVAVAFIVAGVCDLVIAIVFLNTPDKVSDKKTPQTKLKKCPVCEKFIDSGVDFCKFCGTNINEFEKNNCIEPKNKRCSVCNKEIDSDALFCQYCGSEAKTGAVEYQLDTDELVEAEDDDTVVCAFCLKPTSSKYLYCQHCKRRRD